MTVPSPDEYYSYAKMASQEEQQKVFKVCLAQEKVEFQEALTKAVSI